jgi:hypothetical protein
MTSQSPRIYIYKITFEEVPYYYYGVHKERKYDEYYMGTSVTHKWCWEFYTPKKQILQLFEFSDEGWIESQEIEKRLIKSFYNTDKWCLNENCGGNISLDICRKAGEKGGKLGGKIVGKKISENKLGIHGRSQKEKLDDCRKGGVRTFELKKGVHSRTKEEIIEDSKKGGKSAYNLKVGVHSRTPEKMTEDGKKGGKISGQKSKQNQTGIFGRSKEEMIEDRRKGGKVSGKKAYELKLAIHGRSAEQKLEDSIKGGKIAGKISTSQVWQCTITGYRTNAAALSRYQKKRGIDTSNRIRIK